MLLYFCDYLYFRVQTQKCVHSICIISANNINNKLNIYSIYVGSMSTSYIFSVLFHLLSTRRFVYHSIDKCSLNLTQLTIGSSFEQYRIFALGRQFNDLYAFLAVFRVSATLLLYVVLFVKKLIADDDDVLLQFIYTYNCCA